ncbi:hypothetical protein [Oscillatoria salina]|uniref:hypothetical protein n=1 Tax=Oscillatoria salina TaxID=331517 RepID=UPI0013BE6966|nr:hypothetical protein [Oscillatoria salina]MBZ8181891.1 hypothetical protein [Oscillatoria salina IIICB1]NET89214.1 hypothetical protein [Kamptonema sp. SIO1D9]
MAIVETFHLQLGYTVFVGSIQSSNRIVKNTKAKIFIDGNFFQTIEISGEFLTNIKHPQGYRAISTTDKVDIDSVFVKQYFCELKEI